MIFRRAPVLNEQVSIARNPRARVPALRLMMEHAFKICGVTTLRNGFEIKRVAALKSHLAAGFRDCGVVNEIRHVILTRKEYLLP